MQNILVEVFHAGLAGMRSAGISRLVETRQVRRTQRTDIAHGVRDQFAVRIVSDQARLQVDARESRPLDRKVRNLLVGQPESQCDRLETGTALRQPVESRDVLFLDEPDPGEARQGIVDIRHLLRNQLELVGRQVFGDDPAAPVEDQAACWRYGLDSDAIALRLLRVEFVFDDL